MDDFSTLDNAFSRALQGCEAPWPANWKKREFIEVAERRLLYHGIAGLLNERQELLTDWPPCLRDLIRKESLARAMWELRHGALLAEVIEALFHANIPSAVLKGSAIAYSLYHRPALRFRGDSDLLIALCDLKKAREVLRNLGWTRRGHGEGAFGDLHFQEVWQFGDQAGLVHDIDLHWEVTNSRALRNVLDVDHLLSSAVPLPALSVNARAPDPITALIHRIINRAEHARSGYYSVDRNEYDPNRLLWACDIDLLATQLSDSEWELLTRRAIDVGIGSICAEALAFAHNTLSTQISESAIHLLESAPKATPATQFLSLQGEFSRFRADLIAMICPLLSGPVSILELVTKEEWNGKEAQAGGDHRQAA